MKQYVIIGASAAGIAAAQSIRRHDKTAKIVMVSDEKTKPYFRVMLSFVLAGTIGGDKLSMASEGYLTELGITFICGKKALGIDAAKNQVHMDDATRLDYDALLLATGSRPRELDIPGLDKKGIYYFRTRKDMEGVRAIAANATRAVVIGGGLVGIKVSDALCSLGIKVCMMVTSDKVLSQTADPETADVVLNILKSRGLTVQSGVSLLAFQGRGDCVERVLTDTGERISCDLVVIGKGVVPNAGLAVDFPGGGAGSGHQDGIETDGYLTTSVPNIFAAGDVAKSRDIATGISETHAIWPVAVEQGRTAGCNMCGIKTPYEGALNRNAFHIGDSYVITGGLFNPGSGDGCDIHVYHHPQKGFHHRLVTRNDRIVGMAFVNDTAAAGKVLAMIQRKQKLSALPVDILSPGFDFNRLR
ncbi:NAD(P)/FAD-dependent oxidoreductase [Desulfocicer vacuolatum]|nr:FAD-dependent oxidoreductase [Desulfocicer vacuolatum]